MGAGRTEVARAIFGADPLQSGDILVNGRKVSIRTPWHAVANGIGYLSEDRKRFGLATGMALLERRHGLRLVILDKEKDIGMHQTSHNSGVIHMGIYYRPGSMKARLCAAGARRMMEFCDVHGIRYERCGKVIVATSEQELERLETLYQRGLANGVPELRRIDAAELREIEPHAAGLAALHSPCTAIVDYGEVAHAMARDIEGYGAEIRTGAEVVAVHSDRESLRVETKAGALAARDGWRNDPTGVHCSRLTVIRPPRWRVTPHRTSTSCAGTTSRAIAWCRSTCLRCTWSRSCRAPGPVRATAAVR